MPDLLSSISVLLVFLTFLFNGIEKEVNDLLQESKPSKAQEKALEHYKAKVKKLLLLKSIPVASIFIIVFYSLLPKAYSVLSISRLSIWDFDALNTIYIFIEMGLLGLSVFAIAKVAQLIKRFRE